MRSPVAGSSDDKKLHCSFPEGTEKANIVAGTRDFDTRVRTKPATRSKNYSFMSSLPESPHAAKTRQSPLAMTLCTPNATCVRQNTLHVGAQAVAAIRLLRRPENKRIDLTV